MKSLTMAWRNVWRNSRRTLTAVGATALGLLTMILYAGLVEGMMRGMERNLLAYETGDLQVFDPEYRESPSLHDRIEDPDEVLARLDAQGLPAAPRLLGSGLGASEDASAGVSLKGIDVERDAAVSDIGDTIIDGQWLDPAHPGEVVIGRKLAQLLAIGIGDEIVILSQGADGSTANDVYTIRGVVKGVSGEVDRAGVFMSMDAFRELMVVPEGVHQIIVRRGDSTLAAAKEKVTAAAGDLEAKTWRELQPTMASMMDSARGAMVAMFLIIYIAIGIVILNAMLMAVFERIREFGVLKALGVGPAGVLRLILLESAIQTSLAIVIAVVLSLPANWYLVQHGIDLSELGDIQLMGMAWDPVWRSYVDINTYLRPIIILLVIVTLAVVYPALRAAFIRPIEAMRSQ